MRKDEREWYEALGISAADLGRDAFGSLHVAGRTVATLFGGGALVQPAEDLETRGGLLPDWAKSGGAADVVHVPNGAALSMVSKGKGSDSSSSSDLVIAVATPDYVVVQHVGEPTGDPTLAGIVTVVITGGKRFAGNGYKPGDNLTQKFTFGVDSPNKVEITTSDHKKTSVTDCKSVIIYGGTEGTATKVQGETMSDKNLVKQILGELLGQDAESTEWTELVGETEGEFTVGRLGTHTPDFGTRTPNFGVSPLHGLDVVLGAASMAKVSRATSAPRMGLQKAVTPKGRMHLAVRVTVPKKRETDATTIANARDVAKRAVSVGTKLSKLVAAHKTGKKVTVLGATIRPSLKHQKLSLAQIQKIADDTIKVGKDHLVRADKHAALVEANTKRVKAGIALTAQKMKPRVGGSAVHGIYGDVEGQFDLYGDADAQLDAIEALGAIILGTDPAPIPDPLHPGYMTDQSIDPNYGAMNADGTSPDGSISSTTSVPGPDTNYGLGPAPDQAAVQAAFLEPGTFESEAPGGEQTTYTMLPTGAIPFLFSDRAPTFKAVTSYDTYDRLPGGQNPDGGVDSNGTGAGFEWHGDQGSQWWVYYPSNGSSNNVTPPNAQEAASMDTMYDASIANNWGPIKGARTMPDWSGLRYLKDGNQSWFFFRDQCPAWASAGEMQKIANQLTTAYQTQLVAAKQNYAAAVAQDALDAQQAAQVAKQQAAEDLQAQHDAGIQATQQQTQQGALDLQTQQAQLADAQAQSQNYSRQQAQNLDIEQAQVEYFKSHPEAMYQAAPDAPAGGGSADQGDGGGDGGGDDGSSDVEAQDPARGREDRDDDADTSMDDLTDGE